MRPYILSETTWKTVKESNFDLAILPWGATEAHNYHLPYATDTLLADAIAAQAAKQAWEQGSRCIVLPAIPYGVNTGQIDVKLCMNMNPSTQLAVLSDITHVLDYHNINKLLIINAHGGNDFKPLIRELSLKYPKVFIAATNWWNASNANEVFDEPGDHAGELETSMIQFITPRLMLPIEEAGNGFTKQFSIKGLQEGWVIAQRHWPSISQDTGVGNPIKATPEKGKIFFEKTTQAIADFIIQLSSTDLSNLYKDL